MAGSRIKGITIEIDGNTTKLQNALKDVNKDLRTTQSDLRDVNRLLKLDPSNTELLKQKQGLLKKAIEETKTKLDTEKQALEQLKNADQTPEVIRQQELLQRQIAEDEASLKGLEDQSKSFGSVAGQQFQAVGGAVQAIGDKIKDVGENVKQFGTDWTTNISAPILAVGGASLAAFKTVDDGYDIMISKTGATGEAAEGLRGIMENLATTIPTDFETAGAAIGEVNTRFGLTGQELEDLAGQFVKFAELNDTDVSGSIDKVQKAMSAFGLGAEDADDYLDRLNKTGQETGISTDKLADGIVTNAAAFKEMGLTIDEATVFMGELEKSGVSSDTVLGGLRKALKNATKEGIPLDKALSDLQNTIKTGNGSVEEMQEAYELFGNAAPNVFDAVKNGTLDFENLGSVVSDAGGSVNDTFEEITDPMDDFKKTLNELMVVGSEVGATILDVLTPVIQEIGEIIQKIKEKWDALSPGTQDMIVKIAGIVAVVGPLLVVLGTVISTIGSIISIGGMLISGIGLLLSPVGLIVAAIAAAVAIGILLYQNWDKICEWAGKLKDKVVEAWETVKEKVVGFITDIRDKVVEIWNGIKDTVTGVVDGIKSTVTDKFNAVKDFISNTWETVKSNTSQAWENIKSKVEENGGGIKGVIQTAVDVYKDIWKKGFDALDEITGGKLSAIVDWFKDKFDSIKSHIEGVIDWLKGIFDFEWSLPDIKLPHFSWTWLELGPISLPQVSVDWYKKAYETPYLFTSPTVIGGMGFGDGGGSGEIVYGRDQLLRDIAVASSGETNNIINVYAYEGMDVNQLADEIQARLAQLQRQKEAAYA